MWWFKKSACGVSSKKFSGWATCYCFIWILFPLLPDAEHIAAKWRSAFNFLGAHIFLCYWIQHIKVAVGWFCWTFLKPSPGQPKDLPALQDFHISFGFFCSMAGAVGNWFVPCRSRREVWTGGQGRGGAVKDPLSIRSYKVNFNLTVKHSHLSPPLRGSPTPSEGNTLIKWPYAFLHVHLLSFPGVPYKELRCWQDLSVLWRCFGIGYKGLTDSNEVPGWKKKAGKGEIICHWRVKDSYHKTTKLAFSNYKAVPWNGV